MALSTIIKEECPKCGKTAIEVSSSTIFGVKEIKLQCGHNLLKTSLADSTLAVSDYELIKSNDGKSLRPYQIDGIKFWEANDCLGILADEQGLGKMVQGICTLRLHHTKLLPAIIACPTTIKQQWMYEILRWQGEHKFKIQVLNDGKTVALPGFDIYIITYDILKKASVFDYVGDISTIVLDECQRIKNHLADRAKAVQAIVKDRNIKHIMPMSGTPIKNNAGEYFTVLNLVAPRIFPSYERFISGYCNSYSDSWNTKVGGLLDVKGFHEITRGIVLRRTKPEVLPDLPKLDRRFHHVELDRKLNKAYAKALDDLDNALYDDTVSEFERSSNTLAIMARLRHITGISKVTEAIEFTTEFLLSCDRKITIFVHHQDVGSLLQDQLNKWCKDGGFSPILMMHSGLDGNARAELARKFKDEASSRVMIASTLAAGEGLNLQFCSDAIILERQWNPANESQAEARFHRFGQENAVSITYMIASATIDEYFTELVEQKRSIIDAAMDGIESNWQENDLMKNLAQTLVTKGRNRWSLI